jgi:hypothetical protein
MPGGRGVSDLLYWKGGGGFGRLEMASVVGIATRLPEDETTPKTKNKNQNQNPTPDQRNHKIN